LLHYVQINISEYAASVNKLDMKHMQYNNSGMSFTSL